MIDVARRNHPHLRFEVGAMEKLPLQDAALGGGRLVLPDHTAPDLLAAVVSEFAGVLNAGCLPPLSLPGRRWSARGALHGFGHVVSVTNDRHTPQHVVAVLDIAGFDLHAQLYRSAEEVETTAQSVLLLRRRN